MVVVVAVPVVVVVLETGTPVFVLGHDASEQGGIKLLGDHIARRFDIEHIHLHFNVENEVSIYDYSDK